ncbi:chitin deacetylase [Mortierella polycephala]|uniref:Chitin deacetylase n=1 Tax=Mortierella polycephala TaxID=41804 RepID=A0A9P6Q8J8_9FUNG|nr:chitin deacetylase [Mortierella polycephala]
MRTVSLVSVALIITVGTLFMPSAMAEMSKKQQKEYPPKDVLPDVNSEIVKKWVDEVDWSKVPKLPVAKAEIPNSPDCPSEKLIPKDACWWTCNGCVAADDIEICPREKAWGLTYDDGPSPDTPRLLKKLKQANVTSTFFVIGSRVLEHPETLLQEVKEGHHIGLHTWSHAGMTSLTNEQVVAEIKWAEKAVFDVTGLKTKYWRPPYGDVDNRVREIARQLGYVTVIWTKEWDSNDWQIPDKTITNKEVIRNFKWALSTVPKLKGGVITLEHDLYTQTVNVAGSLLDMGMKKGLEPMDIARCVNDPHPYQNSVLAKKPESTDAKKPVADPKKPATVDTTKPAGSAAQKPFAATTPSEADKKAEVNPTISMTDSTTTKGSAKSSSATQLTLTASGVALLTISVLMMTL